MLLRLLQVKIVVAAGQVMSAASSNFSVPWPAVFAEMLDTMKIFLLDLHGMLRTSCATADSFYFRFSTTIVAFKFVAIALFAALIVNKARKLRVGCMSAWKLLHWTEIFQAECQ
mgnify:CR=1 FL=1